MLPLTFDCGSGPAPIDVDSDWRPHRAVAGGCEHPVELHAPLEQDDIARTESSRTQSVELPLRVNTVFLSCAW